MSYAHSKTSARSIHLLPLGALVTLLVILHGCSSHQADRLSPENCIPAGDERLVAGVRADVLTGAYRLTLVATEGPKRGESVVGDLVLLANEPAMHRIESPEGTYRSDASMPLIGSVEIALEDVGGVRMGSLTSSEPMQPGVAVLERHVTAESDTTRTDITLRLGSEANRRDAMRFDGGFMALYVQSVADGSFRGTWGSGVREPEARGHFCAVRVERR